MFRVNGSQSDPNRRSPENEKDCHPTEMTPPVLRLPSILGELKLVPTLERGRNRDTKEIEAM